MADSGKMSHPDLDAKWFGGYNFYEGIPDPTVTPYNDYHHGIHVAGTIAASANNQQGGVGICWSCKIMPILVGAQAPARADVINISMGNSAGPCPAHLHSAIDAAAAAGTVVVVAAGDSDAGYFENGDSPDPNPANYLWTTCNSANLIVVAAADANGYAEPYSLTGSAITVAAPGGDDVGGKAGYGRLIGSGCTEPANSALYPFTLQGTQGVVSSWITTDGDKCYRHWSGTSMAAPHVSGVVALMRSRNPALSVAHIKAILQATATPIPCGSACGAGMVDAYKAVNAATFDVSVACKSLGGGTFYCAPSVFGGAGPFSASWQAVSNAGINGGQQAALDIVFGSCTVGTSAKVKGTFTDAIGRVVTRERLFSCTAVAQ